MNLPQTINLPQTMRFIEITEFGGPDVLKPATGPLPKLGKGDVLIKVHAAGINRADIGLRSGKYPIPKEVSSVLGLEAAGEIVALADDVTRFAIGDFVCALTPGGSYAEYVRTQANQCLRVPKGLSLAEAASLPEAAMTVWSNIFDRAALKSGETLLVHGGTSGIGSFAIQAAVARGVTVITTVGGPEKCEAARKLGAALAIDYRQEDFEQAALAFTQGQGVNVILDIIGGDYTAKNIRTLAMDGRLSQVSVQQGAEVKINLLDMILRRVTLTGAMLKTRTSQEKAQITADVERELWPLIAKGCIKPIVDRVYPLDQAAQAHKDMEKGGHIGKLLLLV